MAAPSRPAFRLLVGDAHGDGPVAAFVGTPRRARADRPSVTVNLVASVDGATGIAGESRELSGPADREVFHALRSITDVILVGAGTVRADRYGPVRPRAGVREARRARGQAPAAAVCVVSGRLELDWASPLFAEAEVPTIVAAPADAPPAARRAATHAGDLICAGQGAVDVAAVLAELGRRGVGGVVCEGGPGLVAQLAGADLLDEICVTLSPLLVGGDSPRMLAGALLESPRRLELAALLEADGFLFARYGVAR